jgi:hypothetical protein
LGALAGCAVSTVSASVGFWRLSYSATTNDAKIPSLRHGISLENNNDAVTQMTQISNDAKGEFDL